MIFNDEKILYRKVDRGAELLRFYSLCGDVGLPDTVGGKVLVGVGDYAFSSEASWTRAYSCAKDILTDGGGDNPVVCTRELLSIELPRELEYIGDYAFYDCRNLTSVSLFGNITEVGGGAFMNCGMMSEITLRTKYGERTCLNKLLSELTRKQRLTIIFEDTGERAALLMPEYFEESIENGPARIFEHFTRGSGFRYRQCIRNGIVDFGEYDSCFRFAVIEESEEICTEIAVLRLANPIFLSDSAKDEYIKYLSENIENALIHSVKNGEYDNIVLLCEVAEPSAYVLELAAQSARSAGRTEILSYLMNEKNRRFGTAKRRKFDL